jgi:LysR family glycine cleavage system transcriptional activator
MNLPPMNALRMFEAVSRLGSVSAAATELCVSQGAVSQQLRNLEDYLGRELFDRTANSIALSDSGRAFAAVVQDALAEIALAAEDLRDQPELNQLTISTWQGFAIKWLMPNLGRFYETCPDVTVAIDESTRIVTFRNDGIDGAIRYGDGNFEGVESLLLLQPVLRAVASPEYLEQHGEMESLADPGHHHLIDHWYPEKELREQHIHWEDLVGEDVSKRENRYTRVPDERQSLTAALLGRGVALAMTNMIEEELAADKIRFAAPGSIPTRGAIYFVWSTDARPNPALEVFRDWLVESLAKYRDS